MGCSSSRPDSIEAIPMCGQVLTLSSTILPIEIEVPVCISEEPRGASVEPNFLNLFVDEIPDDEISPQAVIQWNEVLKELNSMHCKPFKLGT